MCAGLWPHAGWPCQRPRAPRRSVAPPWAAWFGASTAALAWASPLWRSARRAMGSACHHAGGPHGTRRRAVEQALDNGSADVGMALIRGVSDLEPRWRGAKVSESAPCLTPESLAHAIVAVPCGDDKLWPLLPGCTRDTFTRSTYETLQNIQEQRCREQPGLECPPRESYDHYQRRRTGTL
jgi:hypothetical protein